MESAGEHTLTKLDIMYIKGFIRVSLQCHCMIGSDYIPYEWIGFAVSWLAVVLVALIGLLVTYGLWLRGLNGVKDWLWSGKNPSNNERPEGWKLFGAFVVHVVWSVSRFRSPICWRWKTYKSEDCS